MPDASAGPVPIPPPYPPPGPVRRLFYGHDGLRAPWSIVLFAIILASALLLLVMVVGVVMAALHYGLGKTDRFFLIATPLAIALGSYPFAVVVAVATMVMARVERRSPWSYGFAPWRAGRLFAAGFGLGFLALSALVGLLAVTGHLTMTLSGGPPLVALRVEAAWALAFLGVGLFEELLSRGYLQARLTRAIGFWPAAALLSVLFGAAHFSNEGETAIGLIGAGTVGLVFCYSLYRSGSLWWAIGFHTGWDWAQTGFYGTHDSGLSARGALFTSDPAGAPWLSGGTAGPEGSVFLFVILIAVALVIRWTLTPPTTDSRL
jgi:membrane protease YdiL (CAAX protease family)